MNVPRPRHAGELRGHLTHLHGIYVADEKSDDGLRECHRSDHEEPWSHARIPHNHLDARQRGGSNTHNNSPRKGPT